MVDSRVKIKPTIIFRFPESKPENGCDHREQTRNTPEAKRTIL